MPDCVSSPAEHLIKIPGMIYCQSDARHENRISIWKLSTFLTDYFWIFTTQFHSIVRLLEASSKPACNPRSPGWPRCREAKTEEPGLMRGEGTDNLGMWHPLSHLSSLCLDSEQYQCETQGHVCIDVTRQIGSGTTPQPQPEPHSHMAFFISEPGRPTEVTTPRTTQLGK